MKRKSDLGRVSKASKMTRMARMKKKLPLMNTLSRAEVYHLSNIKGFHALMAYNRSIDLKAEEAYQQQSLAYSSFLQHYNEGYILPVIKTEPLEQESYELEYGDEDEYELKPVLKIECEEEEFTKSSAIDIPATQTCTDENHTNVVCLLTNS